MTNEPENKKSFWSAKNILILAVGIVLLAGIGTEAYYLINATSIKQAAIDKAAEEQAKTVRLNAKYSKSELNKMDFPQLSKEVDPKTETKVVINTTEGSMTFKLFKKLTPLAVENFITHAKDGYYNGTEFFRVLKEFMIQGGSPDNTNTSGESIWKGKDTSKDAGNGFKNEISPRLYALNGALAMANSGADTNGSQFFIVSNDENQTKDMLKKATATQNPTTQQLVRIPGQNEYPTKILDAYKKGGEPRLDGSYTIFGQLIDGFDTLIAIAGAPVKTNETTSEKSQPENPVKVTSITVE
ncbi:MAG: peptidylprolyl isomerase [Lactobacillaceae bacterium]|jgi:peptidyl-prolyl cis-trans isomerase A (cyclophilin A)|nr:peptidylprolyl isomerase [Lactobacillaceae bacterium]